MKLRRRVRAAVYSATSAEELALLTGKIDVCGYEFIASHPHCTEQIIEFLWVGDYINHPGKPDPKMVVSSAF